MDHELIRAWRKQAWAKRPYLFSEDKNILPRKKCVSFVSYQKFITDKNFSDHNRSHFHVGLIPVPFHGDLETSDIFICLINPGLNILDYYVETNRAYRKLLHRNLKQKLKSNPYPFIPLDPKWHWTSGGRWWNDLFRKIIGELRKKKRAASYAEAAMIISQRIAALELVPYHSIGSGHVSQFAKELKSSKLVKDFVKKKILPKAKKGQALLVIASGGEKWEIKKGLRNVVYQPKNHRKAHLSMKRGGSGWKILKWLLEARPIKSLPAASPPGQQVVRATRGRQRVRWS